MKPHFFTEHQEMSALAQGVTALVEDRRRIADGELNRLRLALSRTVTKHCSAEAALMNGRETLIPAGIVTRYHDELLKWRRDLIACNSNWPPARVWEDRSGFLAAFKPIAAGLEARVRWEEEEFYPALKKAMVAAEHRAAATPRMRAGQANR